MKPHLENVIDKCQHNHNNKHWSMLLGFPFNYMFPVHVVISEVLTIVQIRNYFYDVENIVLCLCEGKFQQMSQAFMLTAILIEK